MHSIIFNRQLIRFAIVGLTSNFLLYLAYLGITAVGIPYKVAMTILYITAVMVTFVVNRNWSFNHTGTIHGSGIRYVIAYSIGYLLNYGLLLLAVDHLGYPHQLVQGIAVFIVAGCLFLMQRYWVFNEPQGKNVA